MTGLTGVAIVVRVYSTISSASVYLCSKRFSIDLIFLFKSSSRVFFVYSSLFFFSDFFSSSSSLSSSSSFCLSSFSFFLFSSLFSILFRRISFFSASSSLFYYTFAIFRFLRYSLTSRSLTITSAPVVPRFGVDNYFLVRAFLCGLIA